MSRLSKTVPSIAVQERLVEFFQSEIGYVTHSCDLERQAKVSNFSLNGRDPKHQGHQWCYIHDRHDCTCPCHWHADIMAARIGEADDLGYSLPEAAYEFIDWYLRVKEKQIDEVKADLVECESMMTRAMKVFE